MSQKGKATQAAVREAFERLRQTGTPIQNITQSAIRREIGGGSYSSIQQHLKPLREAHTAAHAPETTDVDNLSKANECDLPQAISRHIAEFRGSVDQFTTSISQAIAYALDELASRQTRRHRHEVERLIGQHQELITDLQARYETVVSELDELAAESRDLEDFREQVPTLEGRIERLTRDRDQLGREHEHACRRAEDAEQISEGLRQASGKLEAKLDQERRAAREAEKQASEALAQRAAAHEQCQTIAAERDDANDGWRQAEARCAQLQTQLQHVVEQRDQLERRLTDLAEAKASIEEARTVVETRLRNAEAAAVQAAARADAAERSAQDLGKRLDQLLQTTNSRSRQSNTTTSSRAEKNLNAGDV